MDTNWQLQDFARTSKSNPTFGYFPPPSYLYNRSKSTGERGVPVVSQDPTSISIKFDKQH